VHYWWSVKSGWQEPLIYLLLACVLLWPRRDKLLRSWRQRQRQKLKEA
jgi:sulfoxide reductase heme-binding subunit YedZ